MSVGNNIKSVRKQKQMTQEELSADMGITRSYLSDVENDRNSMSVKTLLLLAGKLNVKASTLLGE